MLLTMFFRTCHSFCTGLQRQRLVALILVAAPSWAWSAPDAGTLQRNLENQLPLPAPLGLKEAEVQVVPDSPLKSGEKIVTVKRFDLQGVKLLSQTELDAVLRPYLNRPLTLEDLQQACNAIEKFYRLRGLMAQAVTPPQTVEEGVLKINITEAVLGNILTDTQDGRGRFDPERAASYITWANPKGQALNLNAITHAILVLNEVPGVNVTSALEPGEKDGETNLRLTLTDGPRYNASADVNNFGSRSTGTVQGMAQATLNNPSGIGDQFSANGIHAEGSTYAQAAYYFPFLPNGLRGGFAGTSLSYKNVPAFQTNGGYGNARTWSASLALPLRRTEESNVNLSWRYEQKSYVNYLLANDAVSSSYQIRNLVVGLAGNQADVFAGGGHNNGQLSLIYGHLQLQADNPVNYGVYTPHRFVKVALSGNRVQTVLPGVSRLLINLSGQWANQNLNSSEQFYLGGPSGVRAYPMAQGGGSQGAQITLEYQHNLPQESVGLLFVDSGLVQQYVHPYSNWQGNTQASNTYALHGAGIGVKWNYQSMSLAATVAWKLGRNPLHNQQGQALDVDGTNRSPRGWLTASYNF